MNTVSEAGVDPRLLSFVRSFRTFFPRETVITSTLRDDGTAHRFGRAVDIAIRSAMFRQLRAGGQLPQYHRSGKMWAYTRATALKAIQAYIDQGGQPTPFLVLVEWDHLHLSIEPNLTGNDPGVYIGYYLPCKHPKGCNTVNPLQIRKLG